MRGALDLLQGTNHWLWRPVIRVGFSASYTEVKTQWTCGDLAEAHRTLDYLDEIDRLKHQDAP